MKTLIDALVLFALITVLLVIMVEKSHAML